MGFRRLSCGTSANANVFMEKASEDLTDRYRDMQLCLCAHVVSREHLFFACTCVRTDGWIYACTLTCACRRLGESRYACIDALMHVDG